MELDSGKTECVKKGMCPLDIRVFIDATQNSCEENRHRNQKKALTSILEYLSNSEKAGRLGMGTYGNGELQNIVNNYEDETISFETIISDVKQLNKNCSRAHLGNIFKGFGYPRQKENTNVDILTFLGPITDSDVQILHNRPKTSDHLLVLTVDSENSLYEKQAGLIGKQKRL